MLVASQLPGPLQEIFARSTPSTNFVNIPMGAPILPEKAEILIAVPFSDERPLTDQPPARWPLRLRWIQLLTVGLDFYPDWFLHGGPAVTLGRGRSAVALAEFALAAIFSAVKRHSSIWIDSADRWERMAMGTVAGSTLGIFGFGELAEALVPRAQALGMNVIAMRKSRRPMPAGVERVEKISELFARSDHIVLAAPAAADTHRVVDARALSAAKPGCHLINIARGTLIDDEALLAALNDDRIGLATIDTTAPEPLPPGHPFYAHPRVRLSPHIATNTADNFIGLAERFAENLERYKAGQPLLDQIAARQGEAA